MTRPAGEALTPISIRLPTADLETMKQAYSHGYQAKIKELIHEHCEVIRNAILELRTKEGW